MFLVLCFVLLGGLFFVFFLFFCIIYFSDVVFFAQLTSRMATDMFRLSLSQTSPVISGVRDAVMFIKSLIVFLYFFFRTLHCLSFDLTQGIFKLVLQ